MQAAPALANRSGSPLLRCIMKRSVYLALALASLAHACMPARPETRAANRCDIMLPGTLGISLSALELAPGETARMGKPMMYTVPHVPPDTLPAACGVRWSAEGGATITDDGELTITRDAAPGSIVVVRAHVDTLVAAQQILVVSPAPNPLAGQWTQDGPALCADGERPSGDIVRELQFRRGGTFSVTRVPFESYRDYWGTYTYEVSTGRLELVVENGNSLPGFTTTAMTARVVGAELIIEGPALAGASSGAGGCRAVFRRPGDPR